MDKQFEWRGVVRVSGARELRCGNCGKPGHSKTTCVSPADRDHTPRRYEVKGTTRCSRCGEHGHNVAKCKQTEVTRQDRYCADCGVVRPWSHSGSKGDVCIACSKKRKALKPKPCAACQVDFLPSRGDQKVCSEECRRLRLSQLHTGTHVRLTGQTLGWWTVVGHESAAFCAVRCRCGFETKIGAEALKKGVQACASCRPKKRLEEMSDERRGEVEASRRAERNRNTKGAHKKHMSADQKAAMSVAEAKQWRLRGREERKKLVNQFKRFPCMDCGFMFPPVCMDFDHRPGETKVAGVSKLCIKASAFDSILDEIDKCDLICSCCHRIRTYKRMLEEAGLADTSGGLLLGEDTVSVTTDTEQVVSIG